MWGALFSFFAGVLTVLAPCVLPLLPIILAGKSESSENEKGIYALFASLGLSIAVFSILLKATTLFINVPNDVWKIISGSILVVIGIITVFPNIWKKYVQKSHIDEKTNAFFQEAGQKKGVMKYVFLGLALGPVFSSCSPTYALILAVILPQNFILGLIYLLIYIVGLLSMLFLISILGTRLTKKLRFVANPNGLFKKILGIIFIVMGIFITFGIDKRIEAYVIQKGYIDTTAFESSLLKTFIPQTLMKTEKIDNNVLNKQMEAKTDSISGNALSASGKLTHSQNTNSLPSAIATAYFAGGCFWCMEAVFQEQVGVNDVISGYAQGSAKDAHYDIVGSGKTQHKEAVKVIYNPNIISYSQLLDIYWSHIDPTNPKGQFNDIGPQYQTVIYYTNDAQKQLAGDSKIKLGSTHKYSLPIVTEILPFTSFFPAEEYHQDFYKKSHDHYESYKIGSGRDAYFKKNNTIMPQYYQNYDENLVKTHSGRILLFFHASWCSTCQSLEKQILSAKIPDDLLILKVDFDKQKDITQKFSILSQSSFVQIDNKMNAYKRILGKSDIQDVLENLVTNQDILKNTLSPLSFEVTQMGGTEKPFENAYWDNHAAGIYVDIVDGTPLFSSTDKFDSGTGWPSFTKPIDLTGVEEKSDHTLAMMRTEVTSKTSNSHLGHVFNDGPKELGGMRYCINSAALRFVAVADMKKEGYEKYLVLFQ